MDFMIVLQNRNIIIVYAENNSMSYYSSTRFKYYKLNDNSSIVL